MPFPALLPLLNFAPVILEAAGTIVEAVTGDTPPDEMRSNADAMAAHLEGLPPETRAMVITHLIGLRAELQRQDSLRFLGLTEGSADKVRATARPVIARRAMDVIATFALVFKIVFLALIFEWFLRLTLAVFEVEFPDARSLPEMVSGLAPVAEMIWVPLLGSFWACVEIVKKYMGVRERDKAHEYEMRYGKPLNSTGATIEAAGGSIAGIVRAIRG